MSLYGMFALAAAVLAIVVSALFIGVCLLVKWISDSSSRASSRQEMRGEAPTTVDSRYRRASGYPVASRRGGR